MEQEGISYLHNEKNIGICYALNALRTLVETDYMVYANDDMYVLPNWDTALSREIESRPDNKWFLSSTLLQPHYWPNASVIRANYGDSAQNFEEERLLAEYNQHPCVDWQGACPPLNVVATSMWDLVGGYSIEFSPGMYSDPDFVAKLYMAGVRYFKGVANSRVYHFETKSTTRIKKNKGEIQFLLKYGLKSSIYRKKNDAQRSTLECSRRNGRNGKYNS